MSNNETETTIDAKKHRDDLRKKREIKNPIVKETPHGGDKIENEPLPEYPFVEGGVERKKKGKVSPSVVDEINEPTQA